jgi:predicted nucleotidyltransferase/uncharacterized protein with HEPN domain
MANGVIMRLRSALHRIESIGNQIEGRSFAEARDDRMFQLGLERQLSQLGNTLGKVIERDPALVETMPLAPSVVDMGETIIRDYDTLDYDAISMMTTRDLPMLAEQIEWAIATYIESPLPVTGRGELIPVVAARRPELIELCHVTRLLMFGLAVNGTFDPERSDIDFAVELGDYGPGVSRRYIGFIVALEDLFGRHVDVVTLHDGLSDSFRNELDRTAVALYERDGKEGLA